MRTKKISSDTMLDLYTDYLICSFSQTSATGMASLLSGSVSHDQVTRFLSEKEHTGKDLWKIVKPILREIESDDGCLVFDDTVEEKPYTDENDIIAWHFDHTVGRSVKGINTLNCVYANGEKTLPVSFEIVKKTEKFIDPKTGKEKRRSLKNKNEMLQEILDQMVHNAVKFTYVLADIWFGSTETMAHIQEKKKCFIFPLKENRLVALSEEEKRKGRFRAVSSQTIETGRTIQVYLKGLAFPVYLAKQVFTNKDGSSGTLYLVTNDGTLDFDSVTKIYHKRWRIEEFHKSIKSNTGFSKSPTQTVRTQSNHFFASLCANVKLECLKWKRGKNHFALKSEIYVQALRGAFSELRKLQGAV